MDKSILLATMVVCFFLGSQNKSDPVSPLMSGDIIGWVELDSVYSVSASKSVFPGGVLIQLEGTSYSAYSDSAGFWKISGVEIGTYNISASKPGFSTALIQSHPFVGGMEPDFAGYSVLYSIPSVYVKSIDSVRMNSTYLSVFGRLSSTVISQSVVIFLGTDSNLVHLQSNYLTFDENNTYTDSFWGGFDLDVLKTQGVNSGSKVYLVAYTLNRGAYRDVTTQRTMFTALCSTPSEIVSCVIP